MILNYPSWWKLQRSEYLYLNYRFGKRLRFPNGVYVFILRWCRVYSLMWLTIIKTTMELPLRWLFGAEDRWLLRESTSLKTLQEATEVRRMNCNSSWLRGKQRSAAEKSLEHMLQDLLITSLKLMHSLCLLWNCSHYLKYQLIVTKICKSVSKYNLI